MICPSCNAGNSLPVGELGTHTYRPARPGTVAAGTFCQHCGWRLIPEVVKKTAAEIQKEFDAFKAQHAASQEPVPALAPPVEQVPVPSSPAPKHPQAIEQEAVGVK